MAESSVAADNAENSVCSSLLVISSSEEETPVRSVSPLAPVSLLDKLHTPKRSRKRKVCTNPPQLVKGLCCFGQLDIIPFRNGYHACVCMWKDASGLCYFKNGNTPHFSINISFLHAIY